MNKQIPPGFMQASKIASHRPPTLTVLGILSRSVVPALLLPWTAALITVRAALVSETELGTAATFVLDVTALGRTYDSYENQPGPGVPYGKSNELILFPEPDGEIAVFWQDYLQTNLYVTSIAQDFSLRTVNMPQSLGILGSATRDPDGNWYYVTAEEKFSPRILLIKTDRDGRTLRQRELYNGDTEFNVWQLWSFGNGVWLRYANNRLCMVLARIMQKSWDGLNHQGSIVAVFNAEDLSTVQNFGQNSSHSFDSRVIFDGERFVTMSLGDGYPRGIVVHKVTDNSMRGRVVYTFKTHHDPVPSPYRQDADGVPLPAGKWSNDNRTYTELGDIVTQPHGYSIVFTSEKSIDNSLATNDVNEARNVGYVLLKREFEMIDQEANVVPPGMILTEGADSPEFGFYTFDGLFSRQQYRGVVWLTTYSDPESENASRAKMISLRDDRLLILWEKWTRSSYATTFGMIINEKGEKLIEETDLGRIRLNKGDQIVRAGSKVHMMTGTGNQLVWTILETPANLFKEGSPLITRGPRNFTAITGMNVSFTVTAAGAAPLSYQWKINGNNIPGATNSILALSNVRTNDEGSYTVVVRNQIGTVVSNQAVLIVQGIEESRPVITKQPRSITALAGMNVSFTVEASGFAPLSYQWKADGIDIPGATNSILALGNVRTNDAGIYTVVVTNQAGAVVSNPAMLTVQAEISLLNPPFISREQAVGEVALSKELVADIALFKIAILRRIAAVAPLTQEERQVVGRIMLMEAHLYEFSDQEREAIFAALIAPLPKPEIVKLGIRLDSSKIELFWPTANPGFKLQKAFALSSTAEWVDVNGVPTENQKEYRMLMDAPVGTAFFRLIKR